MRKSVGLQLSLWLRKLSLYQCCS